MFCYGSGATAKQITLTRNCLSASKIGDRRFPSAGKRLPFNVLIISGMLLSLPSASGEAGMADGAIIREF